MRVVIHKNGMLEMSIINVIFLTNLENCARVLITSLLISMFVFCLGGFFNKATVYTLERIFTQNTSKDVVLGKEVPFGGRDDYV